MSNENEIKATYLPAGPDWEGTMRTLEADIAKRDDFEEQIEAQRRAVSKIIGFAFERLVASAVRSFFATEEMQQVFRDLRASAFSNLIGTEWAVEQYRFPKSKKKRIRRKWAARPCNYRPIWWRIQR